MFGKGKEAARIGLTAHTAVLHKLVSKGLEVLQPLGDHLRYDLAYYQEDTAELIRIQCKAGRYLIELGFEVLEPVGNHLRYDLAYYVPASPVSKSSCQ